MTKQIGIAVGSKPEPEKPREILEFPENAKGFAHREDRPTWARWDRYCEWRRTKCPPLRSDNEELIQATLELCGEVAELQIAFSYLGHRVFTEEGRELILGEAGDVLFETAWAFDAWKANLLVILFDDKLGTLTDDELATPSQYHDIARKLFGVRPNEIEDESKRDEYYQAAGTVLSYASEVLVMLTSAAGLTANQLKKRLYQGKSIAGRDVSSHLLTVIAGLERLLCCCYGLSLEDAAKNNVEKLDKRFPFGYTPDGGIRS